MIVLGVDPGLAHVGAAIIVVGRPGSRPQVGWTEPITTTPSLPEARRWEIIAAVLLERIRKLEPAIIGVESQRGAWLGRAKRGQTSADSLAVLECVGLVRGIAAAHGIPVVAVEPRSVKIALLGRGGGNAPKSAIVAAVRRLFSGVPPRCSDHQADAMAVALAAARRAGR